MWFGTEEERTDRINRIVEDYMEVTSLYPAIDEVLKDFDGKCFNKRFAEALSSRTGKYIVATVRDLYIEFYYYGGLQRHILFKIRKAADGTKTRISYVECHISAKEFEENYRNRAKGMAKSLEVGPDVMKRVEELIKEIHETVEQIPFEAREFYDIPSFLYI